MKMTASEWKKTKFGQFASLHRGYDLPIAKRRQGKIPVVGSNGVVGYHDIAKFGGPGVMVGRSGSVGKSYYIDDSYWPLNTALFVEHFHGNNPRFVEFFCRHFDFSSYAAGVSVPTLNRNLVHAAEITVPPFPEQKRIAAILLKIQRAIETEEKIIQSLSDLKKSTMEYVFTHGLRGEKTKMTEIGEIPESWEIVPLGQIASMERGKFTHRPRNDPDYYGGDIPFIQTGDVTQSNGRIRTYSQTLNQRGLSVSKIFLSGTILITIAANIGDTGILEFDSAFPDSIIAITPGNEVGSQYLEFYLRTQKRRMHQLAPKGTQMNINIEFLKPWPVKLPPTGDQLRIAQVLGCVVQKKGIHESKKSALQDLFKATLNKLMAGDIRVGDLNVDTNEVEEHVE
jgi:type I restriction enzyme S subunit